MNFFIFNNPKNFCILHWTCFCNVNILQQRRVVVVVSVCKFPGCVFTSCPESFYVNREGKVVDFNFPLWKDSMLNPLRGNAYETYILLLCTCFVPLTELMILSSCIQNTCTL